MFEAVEFIDRRDAPEAEETVLGEYSDEMAAVGAARDARRAFMESGSDDYAWWVVRKTGARLAQFIADSKSDREFVLDLTSGQLVEV
jgi:hypothetical protein